MRRLNFVILLSSYLFFTACDASKKGNLMPMLAGADSIAVIFYNTPNNPRFFKYVKQYDVKKLESVIDDANGDTIQEKSNCPTQGKIYFYRDKGAVDVLYFSSADECMTFSFIITGEKYNVKMSKGSKDFINNIYYPLAKEPISANPD